MEGRGRVGGPYDVGKAGGSLEAGGLSRVKP